MRAIQLAASMASCTASKIGKADAAVTLTEGELDPEELHELREYPEAKKQNQDQ
jgi:hypothetical protein